MTTLTAPVAEQFRRMREAANRTVVGQDTAFELLVVAMLARGHVLLEGVPGTAKTLMAKTLAHLIQADFSRVQFTPDLMPSDVVGTYVFNLNEGKFHLRKGPIFTSILLGDEINRAPAKTQSSMLEAMEERQVTIEGNRFDLPHLFMVIATQNPVEYEGTYPLPEAQLDRFLFKVPVSYAPLASEQEVLRRYHEGFDAHNLATAGLQPIVTPEQVAQMQALVRQVTVDDGIIDYITRIADASRKSRDLLLGGSPRASISLLLAVKAYAAIQGRDFVVPDDIKFLAPFIYRHRILLRPEAEIEGLTADSVMAQLLGQVEV
ncbi:MAG: MoxR family ATPase, partial [Ardenticatenales bacterium]|nr:MoxR family ATPase [Ardenticatenales bacterium]